MMRKYRVFWMALLGVCVSSLAAVAHAQDHSPFVPLDCEITPAVGLSYISIDPPEKSNNLRRKEGAGIVANGIYTEIKGVVLDQLCVPVTNAVVQLWQTDKAGNYEQYYAPKSEWDIVDENYDENFAYSGVARTNNRGEFYFLTIFPGSYAERAPHLNLRVIHEDFPELNTQVFFAKHPRNAGDTLLSRLTPPQRDLLTAQGEPLDDAYRLKGRRYNINLTLEGQNRYQRY